MISDQDSESRQVLPALFLHIQKTAGSSIIEHAREYYGESLTSHDDCWGHDPSEFQNTLFVSGHIGYDYARHLMSSRYSFTFLRNPRERILSMYYFCRNRNPEEFKIYRAANERNLDEFLHAGFKDPLVKKNIWNNQVWQLAHGYAHLDDRRIGDFEPERLFELAVEHINKLSFAGLTEYFQEDSRTVFRALGLPLPRQKLMANANPDRPAEDNLSGSAVSMLYELTELDQRLYDHVLRQRSGRAL